MQNKFILQIIIFCTFFRPCVKAQGCSDAGFCTSGALSQYQTSDTTYKQSFKANLNYGSGEDGTVILQVIPEFEFSFLKKNHFQIKIPYSYISGKLGQTNGLSDISLILTRQIFHQEKLNFSISGGVKIATGKSDLKKNSLSLPMPYQVSLGTYDIIIGAALIYNKWNFAAGFQGVLSNNNKNTFLRSDWASNDNAQNYFDSNGLIRSNDILVRIEKGIVVKRINFSVGLLGIYHLQKDQITLNVPDNRKIGVEGSDGITLNLTGGMEYAFSNRNFFLLSFGTPLLVRLNRPDGLTRSLVVNLAYQVKF